MKIVKSARWVGRCLGRVLDEEDRELFGRAIVIILGIGFVLITSVSAVAASAAIAIRLFQAISG